MQWNNRIVFGHMRTIKISKTITQRLFQDEILKQTDLGKYTCSYKNKKFLRCANMTQLLQRQENQLHFFTVENINYQEKKNRLRQKVLKGA